MLTGAYDMSVDAKGRVTLPAKYRKELLAEGETALKLVPLKDYVSCFTVEGFKNWTQTLFGNGEETRNAKDAALKRYLMGNTKDVEVDSAGRVALGKLDSPSRKATERLGLTDCVTVVGADDHLEVWNTEKWYEMCAACEEDLNSMLFNR